MWEILYTGGAALKLSPQRGLSGRLRKGVRTKCHRTFRGERTRAQHAKFYRWRGQLVERMKAASVCATWEGPGETTGFGDLSRKRSGGRRREQKCPRWFGNSGCQWGVVRVGFVNNNLLPALRRKNGRQNGQLIFSERTDEYSNSLTFTSSKTTRGKQNG